MERNVAVGPSNGAQATREVALYQWMRLIRAFEERVSALHRQNLILGGVYSGAGQEAVSVGTCFDLEEGDVVFPVHRDMGVFLVRGVDLGRLMAQLLGREGGLSRGKDSFLHAGDPSHGVYGATSMLAGTLPVACGCALKFKLKKERHIAVAYFGEGSSNRGDFHEALNFAGIHKLPVIFVCENNRYAFTTPNELESAVEDIADRAAGYGMKGVVCPGNDLGQVIERMQKAAARARAGEGPTLLECKTYRIRGHSEHDPATYRSSEEVIEWRGRDPIGLWELFLAAKGLDVPRLRAELDAEIARVIDDAVAFGERSPFPEPESAMEDIYATPIPPGGLSGPPGPDGAGETR